MTAASASPLSPAWRTVPDADVSDLASPRGANGHGGMRRIWCGGRGWAPRAVISTKRSPTGPPRQSSGFLPNSRNRRSFSRAMRHCARVAHNSGDIADLRAWWAHRLLDSANPLVEKMTLFWHGHFATSNAKVQSLQQMAAQNALFRRHALGSFRELLHEWPAMSRCWCGWMGTRIAGGSRTKTSPASSWSCFRWASATIRNEILRKPPARSAAGTFARANSGSIACSTMRRPKQSSAKPATSTATMWSSCA